MVVEDHLLAVPDEQSAIAAARAWMAGHPPTGCPYEAGADTSKIAMGGLLGQAEAPGGKLRVLMYWSVPFVARSITMASSRARVLGFTSAQEGYCEASR